jgi:hypothetical protein
LILTGSGSAPLQMVHGLQSRRVRDDASAGAAPGEARAGPVVFCHDRPAANHFACGATIWRTLTSWVHAESPRHVILKVQIEFVEAQRRALRDAMR